MDQRAKIPVSLPVTDPEPTRSYWQDPPDDEIGGADYRSPSDRENGQKRYPSEADTVIVGSGITGAAVGWGLLSRLKKPPKEESGGDDDAGETFLSREGEKKSWEVVMLEARGAVSGATGRNGGHTKAASYRSFEHHVSTLGLEEARKIARLELRNIEEVHTFIEEKGIKCENMRGDTVDIVYDQAEWENSLRGVEMMRREFGNEKEGEYRIYDREEAMRELFAEDTEWNGQKEEVRGAIRYAAGSLSAYKFGVGVLKMCLDRGMGLWTGAKVVKVEKSAEDGGSWKVKMENGEEIKARRVVLATNGYTAALVPDKFQEVIVPLRGQVTAQRPGRRMPNGGSLETTYSFIYDGGYEYMVTRPKGVGARFEGDVIMGGGLVRGEKSEGGMMEFGITDDSKLNVGISEYLRETTRRYFGKNWGEDNPDGRVRQEWTGIMGFSADGLPLVGEVPGEKGLWVSVSFQGHGMVLCWMCAKALVEMMETENDGSNGLEAWFPDGFKISEERLKKRFQGRFS